MVLRHVFSWLLRGSIAVAAVLALATVSSPFWLRLLIEQQASAKLARPVSIGRVHLRGNPPAMSIDGVVIGNPDGFPPDQEPLARVSRVTARFDLAASLRRWEIAIASIELDHPMLHAVATEDGRENYRFARRDARSPWTSTVRIHDGHVRASLPGRHTNLEIAFATQQGSQGPGLTRLVAEVQGTYAGQPFSARLAGEVPPNVDDDVALWPVELEVQHGATHVSASGTLQDPISLRSGVVALALAGPDMAVLEVITGVPFPTTPAYDLHGRLNFTPEAYHFTDAAGRLGRSDLQGNLTVVTGQKRPVITAEIQSRDVDLADLASLLSGGPGRPGTPGETPQQHVQAAQAKEEAQANPRVLPHEAMRLPTPEALELHLTYRAHHIKGDSMPIDNLAFHADVVGGTVALRPLRLGVGRGQILSDVSLAPHAEGTVRALTKLRLEQLDVAHLMRVTGGYHGAGVLNGIAHIEGTGRSVADILGAADGAVSLKMTGGHISALLANLAGLRLGSALLASLGDKPNSRIDCFVADLALSRGLMLTRRLLLETEDAVIQGEGQVDLRQEKVNIRLRTESRHLTIGVLPAPLLVSGTLKKLHAVPDPAAPAGRGGLAGVIAALPTVQPGIGDGSRCQEPMGNRRGKPEPK